MTDPLDRLPLIANYLAAHGADASPILWAAEEVRRLREQYKLMSETLQMIRDPELAGKTWQQVVADQRLNADVLVSGEDFICQMYNLWIHANWADKALGAAAPIDTGWIGGKDAAALRAALAEAQKLACDLCSEGDVPEFCEGEWLHLDDPGKLLGCCECHGSAIANELLHGQGKEGG